MAVNSFFSPTNTSPPHHHRVVVALARADLLALLLVVLIWLRDTLKPVKLMAAAVMRKPSDMLSDDCSLTNSLHSACGT